MDEFSIAPGTRPGPVHLAVAGPELALGFYTGVLRLRVLDHQGDRVHLGVPGSAEPLLILSKQPGARPRPPRTTGLYHVAILLPSRADLARALRHLGEVGYPLAGASDHRVSEAIYLADPDGNGLEIYADRPREAWTRRDGSIQMASDPLDAAGLMDELKGDAPPWEGPPAGTVVGHVHLQVSDLGPAERFYHGLLGLDIVARFGPAALFLSAGGYHHHLGLNTWESAGAPPPPPEATGLRYFTLRLPSNAELDRVVARLTAAGHAGEHRPEGLFLRDPSGNGVLIVV